LALARKTKPITVSVVNDTLIESDETVIVSLSNPAKRVLDATPATPTQFWMMTARAL